MKLVLTDNDGIVINTWTIGSNVEFDVEDLDAEPKYDFYTDGYSGADSLAGEVWSEIMSAKERGDE